MSLTNAWTGQTACALQSALRLSNEAFAARLGVGVRTVAAWHQKPDLRPKSEMQQLLDTALAQASDEAQARFAQLAGVPSAASSAPDAERRLAADPTIGRVLDWLDTSAGWRPGTARRKVSGRSATVDVLDLHDRGARRSRVDQLHIAHSLRDYYARGIDEYGTYGARYDQDGNALTSVLTSPRWLDLECALTPENDRLAVVSGVTDPGAQLDELVADHATQRLAQIVTLGFRLVDTPMYRLQRIDIGKGSLAGDLGLIPFVRYALTMDLLEGEMIDAVSAGAGRCSAAA